MMTAVALHNADFYVYKPPEELVVCVDDIDAAWSARRMLEGSVSWAGDSLQAVDSLPGIGDRILYLISSIEVDQRIHVPMTS